MKLVTEAKACLNLDNVKPYKCVCHSHDGQPYTTADILSFLFFSLSSQ